MELLSVLFLIFLIVALIILTPARRKLVLYYHAVYFWYHSQEHITTEPASVNGIQTSKLKTVLFIRHGESEWNSIVNEFDILWLYRVVRILLLETYALFFREFDSRALDSPLNPKGLRQAQAAAPDLTSYMALRALSKRRCCFVSSQLRRAVETAIFACDGYLARSNKLQIRSELQELSPNVDAYSLCKKGTPPKGLTFSSLPFDKVVELCDYHANLGNKTLRPGDERIEKFAHWLLTDEEHDVYVVVGHSLWMKRFFARYIPASEHANTPYVREKIKNGGIVSFDFACKDGHAYVVPSSIRAVN